MAPGSGLEVLVCQDFVSSAPSNCPVSTAAICGSTFLPWVQTHTVPSSSPEQGKEHDRSYRLELLRGPQKVGLVP